MWNNDASFDISDKVTIYYSGGSDSHTILKTFGYFGFERFWIKYEKNTINNRTKNR